MRGALVLAFIVAGTGPSEAQTTSEGRALFGQYCSIPYCHGADGGEGRAPALRGGVWSHETLAGTIENGVPDTSMPPFGDRLSSEEVQAIVSFILSIGREAAPEASANDMEGDPAHDLAAGRAIFYEGRCSACHRFGRDDLPGPDLRASAEKSPLAILRDIREPDRAFEGARPSVRIHLNDGTHFDAVVQEETETFVRANDLSVEPYVLRRVSRARIERTESLGRSVMPRGLADGLSAEQVRDLVFFIRSGGNKDDAPAVVRREAEVGTLFLPVLGEEGTLPAVVMSGLAATYAVYVAAEGFVVLDVGDEDPGNEAALALVRTEERVDPDRISTIALGDDRIETLESAIVNLRERLPND